LPDCWDSNPKTILEQVKCLITESKLFCRKIVAMVFGDPLVGWLKFNPKLT